MPCRSDYMEPTGKEKRLQETAALLLYFADTLELTRKGSGHRPPVITAEERRKAYQASKDPYCSVDFVPRLCEIIRSTPLAEREAIIYDGRVREARRLADWWDEHKAADEARAAAEAAKIAEEAYVLRILKKLDIEEQEALAEYFANQV